MKALISIFIVLLFVFVVWKVWDYWDRVSTEREQAAERAKRPFDPQSLPGLDSKFENSLQEALGQKDPDALKIWLDRHRPVVKDPRLAWIELDYVQLIAPRNPVEAKKVFNAVKERSPEEARVNKRIQELEKIYQ